MCPFVNKADPRCAAHLTFRNLVSAFEHCADQYTRCHVYHELLLGPHADSGHGSADAHTLLAAS